MDVANERNLRVIEYIANPGLIEDYFQTCAALNLDRGSPFLSREFEVLQWHLCFPHLVMAYKLDEDGFKELFRDFFESVLPRLGKTVVVGDYVRAPMELRLIKPHFGFGGLFATVTNRQIRLDEMTRAVMEFKLKGMLATYNLAATESARWVDPSHRVVDWRAIKSISNALALCVVLSYWGRPPTPTEEKFIDQLGDIIYETSFEVNRMMNET